MADSAGLSLRSIRYYDTLPRNAPGKVDKRVLRERHMHRVACLNEKGI